MPSKREQMRERQAQQQRQTRMIQMIGAGVIVLLIAVVIWQALPKKTSQQTTAVDIGNQPACDIFDSIPIAAQYEQPPRGIDTSKQYFATVKMAKGGEFVIQLYADKAPITVNSFVFLACKGFYNGVTFHRVLSGFMAQGGDPTGSGNGGPGYQFVNEDSDLTFDKEGVVAMANAGRDTNGSQFFITFAPQSYLNGAYTIFGQVIQGMDVVKAITLRDPDQAPTFQGDAMESVMITTQ
jgi:peptidylprolyl isomerase